MKQFASDNAFTFDGGLVEDASVDHIELINGSPLNSNISAFGGFESVLTEWTHLKLKKRICLPPICQIICQTKGKQLEYIGKTTLH